MLQLESALDLADIIVSCLDEDHLKLSFDMGSVIGLVFLFIACKLEWEVFPADMPAVS